MQRSPNRDFSGIKGTIIKLVGYGSHVRIYCPCCGGSQLRRAVRRNYKNIKNRKKSLRDHK